VSLEVPGSTDYPVPAQPITCHTLMTRGNMSRRFGLLITIAIAILLPWTGLFSQETLPNTLAQLQETLKRLQSEVKALQGTVQRLMKDAKNNKGGGTPAAAPSVAAVAVQSNWRNALEAYKHGKQLEQQRQYGPAIEAYSRAIQFDPKSDTAFLHRGNCLLQLGENADAVADFTQSLTLQPNSSRAYLARALALAATGQDEKALADADQALQRDPQYLDAYLLRGRLYQLQGNHDLASADFTKAVSVAPQSEKAYLGRADILESAGQPEQALNDCQNAVRINPNSAAGYLCRAESYLKMKLAERAVEDVNRAVVTAQTFNQPLPLGNSLAQALQESVSAPVSAATQGAPVAASPVPMPVAAQQTVVAQQPAVARQPVVAQQPVVASAPVVSPLVPRAPASVAKPAAIAGGMQRPAPSAAQQADAQQYVQQGRELVQKDQFSQAIGPLDRAIDTDPWSAAAYNLRGYAHLRLKQYEQAAADCSEAIRLQPNFLNAYENRSSARRHQGDRAGAQEDARKVADLLAEPQKSSTPNSPLSAKR
jgi:tetratricopeptide (TPR) repeat protein